MLKHPQIDPVALSIGPVDIHWYGLLYLLSFFTCWFAMRVLVVKPDSPWSKEQVSDLLFFVAMGVVLGGRVGHVLFYNFSVFLADPIMLFRVWQGGMSFHGGMLGVLVGIYWFGWRSGKSFFAVADRVAIVVPLGLGLGRLANFINGELWGRVTDVPWGMVFANADNMPRHPSQLYQFALEGVVMFLILWWFAKKPRPLMAATGLFGLLYGMFRFVVEFVRQPDAHLNFVAFEWMTMGQLLSLPMVIIGAAMVVYAYRRGIVLK